MQTDSDPKHTTIATQGILKAPKWDIVTGWANHLNPLDQCFSLTDGKTEGCADRAHNQAAAEASCTKAAKQLKGGNSALGDIHVRGPALGPGPGLTAVGVSRQEENSQTQKIGQQIKYL